MNRRYLTAAQYDRETSAERGPNGRRLCRWCRTEVPSGRRTFCGDPVCYHEWRIRSDIQYATSCVYARDRGVCVLCGLDTIRLASRIARLPYFARREVLGRDHGRIMGRLWDVDHIVPVSYGGGVCGLDNLRTLCIWCHKRATRLLARRRAVERRAARASVVFQSPLF